MRGCLTFVLTIVVVVGALAWFVPPPVADAVLSQAFTLALGGPMTARVQTDFPPSLLTLRAPGVAVTGSDADLAGGALRAGSVNLRLRDVDLVARTAGTVEGTLSAATFDTAQLGTIAVRTIALSGPTSAIAATATIAADEASRIVAAAVTSATGRSVGSVTLVAPDVARAAIDGTTVRATVDVENGDLIARLPIPGAAPVTLLHADALAPLELTSVRVTDAGLVLSGLLTGAALGF